ncbi:unnamed protein product [Ceutorhynchus assimilis]|uniref:Cytochrome P450 n=1 Tax=Ceutorhynchus assimilis TaxID=467358 RepID=A0A9P0GQR2_9CUCU|nr:unnamed protein product [Ceutorhynchus assimilis]
MFKKLILKMLSAILVPLFLALSACIIVFMFYIKKYYKYWEKRNVPIESNFFLVNNTYSVFSGKLHFGSFLIKLYQSHPEDPYFGFYILGKPHLFIRCPNVIKRICENHEYFQDRSFFCEERVDPIVSKSVFMARNPEWRDSRQKLNTLFSPAKFKAMVPKILSHCKEMNLSLEQYDNQIIDVQITAESLITNVVSHIFLGIDSQCEYDTNDNVVKTAMKHVFGKGWYQGLAFFVYTFAPKLVKVLKISLIHDDFIKTIVKDVMRSYYDTKDIRGTRVIDILAKNNINIYQESENFFDENWLVGQSSTIVLASFIPMSAFFALSLYELSLNQEYQEKLREEIFGFISDENFDETLESIRNMKYLNMVVAEILRLYPLGDFVNRNCNKDYVLQETGLKVEKGTPIMISVSAIHADPKFFPDPCKFDPGRFENGTKEFERAGVYFPFGFGQRSCLGGRFSLVAIKIALVEVLRKFKFEPCNETERPIMFDNRVINISPINGIKLRITKL